MFYYKSKLNYSHSKSGWSKQLTFPRKLKQLSDCDLSKCNPILTFRPRKSFNCKRLFSRHWSICMYACFTHFNFLRELLYFQFTAFWTSTFVWLQHKKHALANFKLKPEFLKLKGLPANSAKRTRLLKYSQ